MSAYLDDLLVNGTSIQSVPSLQVEDWSGLLVSGPYRGENITFPGLAGQTSYAKVRDAYAFAVPVHIGPEDASGVVVASFTGRRQQMLSNYAALQALFPSNVVTLTRRLSAPGTGYTDTTCNGEFLGFEITDAINQDVVRGVLTLLNLDGGWA